MKIIAALLLLSCASCMMTYKQPEPVVERDFEVGTERAVSVGVPMTRTTTRTGKETFELLLIYLGRGASGAIIESREFLNGYARPAFTQRYEQDSSSPTMTIRNLKIAIASATPNEIHFTVLSDSEPLRRDFPASAPTR